MNEVYCTTCIQEGMDVVAISMGNWVLQELTKAKKSEKVVSV